MAKPDNRADNAERLAQHANNTEHNLHEAEAYLDEHADEISSTEYQDILEKNENRKRSISGFKSEIKDES